MTAKAAHPQNATILLLPATLLALALAAMAVQIAPLPALVRSVDPVGPATVTLPPGHLTYRAPGHYLRDAVPVDAPMTDIAIAEPLTIMQYQVSAADYARCVNAGACATAEPRHLGSGDVPATGVNYGDALAYAAWLSAETGQTWTLPSDAEWAYAAGERFADDALGLADDRTNPALRWIADYRREAARKRAADPLPRPLGSFGANANGLMDIAGNVWEWTDTCHARIHIDAAGDIVSQAPACTIRILAGQHRTPVSYFIRDARSGGCSVGVPPDNLGFRLVRRPAWHEMLLARFGL
ncbi:SUMF1/EgtB/PvdO family nonheme iron enzyme [Devosia sp. YIM 151766]|uniref:SUMF1/EgtB/PvdO family nonheme iron enzyme n=1 Tax=Devosia sp. YIM 151766 TaxID=3017325 RepID=UPI00255C5381|nr:SUMF1/EgtB/PvdO family nonheme iron enzyme [Devosia sp. YIM 151766]WIY52361.1 SUMF1/EgtB/PvdO family nonheme iron enzyme [Devosia sp. YIM 151766]